MAMVEVELLEMGLSWGKAQLAAKDRDRWRNMIDALCPTGGKEDKSISCVSHPAFTLS